MRLPVRCLSIAACIAGLSGAVKAEQIDNPAYQSWAKFKPGTTVTYKQTTEMNMPAMAGMSRPESVMTEKLIDVKPDAAIVEITMETTIMGQKHTMPARQTEVPAKIDKDKEGVPPNMKGEIKDMKEGKDKVDVNGKSVDATTREFTVVTTEPRAMTANIKIWSTPDVPGGMVKTISDVQEPMKATSTMTLVDFQPAK
ncbi:MAG TPA: hypothetical protein VM008_12940 [Phycisphaerae bacterium]|nr:hypothetical protein [Phycisphaerae bacterium]